jgi:hypothetical protein
MTADRQHLPNRRPCETFTFEHGSMKYTASTARYADGRLAEILSRITKPAPMCGEGFRCHLLDRASAWRAG